MGNTKSKEATPPHEWWQVADAPTWNFPYLWTHDTQETETSFNINPVISLPLSRDENVPIPTMNGYYLALGFRVYQQLLFNLSWLHPHLRLVRITYEANAGMQFLSMKSTLHIKEPVTDRAEWKVEGFYLIAARDLRSDEDPWKPMHYRQIRTQLDERVNELCAKVISTLQEGAGPRERKLAELQSFDEIVRSRDPIFPYKTR